MKKCPGCGTIVQDADTCGFCGASLLETQSEPMKDLVEEEANRRVVQPNPHWKRKALLPPLVFLGLSLGLILSGFFLVLYSQPSFRGFTSFFIGFILLSAGFLVLLYVVIGAGPSERYRRVIRS